MSKISKQERAEAIRELQAMLKPGTKVHTILRHVSRSGMMRHVSLVLIRNDEIYHITSLVSRALGWPVTSKGDVALKIPGCGMDMGFHIVYSLSRVLFPMGYSETGEQKADGGYALKHEWL